MSIEVSTAQRAGKSLVTHWFRPGGGYVDYGVEPERRGAPIAGEAACLPPTGTPDRSIHMLRGAGGAAIRMMWIEREKAWARSGGIRMAFKASYLAHYGWSYLNAVA